jgi:hypothetical protein
LDDALEQLDERVRLTALDQTEVDRRAMKMAATLLRSKLVHTCKLVGSLSRKTGLRNLSDIDLLAIMEPMGDVRETPEDFISAIVRLLRDTQASINSGSIAITVNYTNWPSIDIIPAKSDSKNDVYLIPSGSGSDWQEYSPRSLELRVAELAGKFGSKALTLIRLLKLWKYSKSIALESSDIEYAACVALERYEDFPSYPKALQASFELIYEWRKHSSEAQLELDGFDRIQDIDGGIDVAISAAITASRTLVSFDTKPLDSSSRNFVKELFGVELAS